MSLLLSFIIAALPYKGIVFWSDTAADHPEINDAISMEYSYMLPSDVVVGPGKYDWTKVDEALNEAANRGHTMILRFRYEYPGEKLAGVRGATAVPKYIKGSKGYSETFAANPNGDGPTWYADWSSKILEDFTLEFYRAFAEKYDNDSRLAYLEVGFGHWSEYHTYGTKTIPGKNFPTKEYQAKFITEVTSFFKKTPVLVSIDAQDEEYSPLAKEENLRRLAFGLFDDSLMHSKHDISDGDGYNEQCWNKFGPDRWKTSPCGGEISYYRKKDQLEFLNPKGLYGHTWKSVAAKYHLSFVIANDSLEGKYTTPKRLKEAAAECGYNFKIVSDKTVGGSREVVVENTGVAPAYHDFPVTIDGITFSSLKGLLPRERRVFSFPECNAVHNKQL